MFIGPTDVSFEHLNFDVSGAAIWSEVHDYYSC